MKILIAVHHFPPTFEGGTEWRAYRTAVGLQQAGHKVAVVCVDSITHGDGQTLENHKTITVGLTLNRLYFNLAQSTDPLLWSYRNPLVGEYIFELLTDFRPDVLHVMGGYLVSGTTIEAARAAGVPVVLTLTDFWFLCPRITLLRSDDTLCTTPADPLACALCLRKEKRRYRVPDHLSGGLVGRVISRIWQKTDDKLVRRLRERKDYLTIFLESIDAVVSPSRFLKDFFKAQGIEVHRFLYIRQGLDASNWADAKPIKNNSHLRIGYIGEVVKHKGVDVLVKAVHQLRAGEKIPQLTLYGNAGQFTDFANKLHKKIQGREDIILAGRFENSQIRSIHAGIDVLVVPSVWYENSPNVILEAFENSTPLVVSRLGGMLELVADGVNGFHFEPGNAESLAKVLQRFVDHPELVANLSQGMPPVKTVKQEIQELLQVYTSFDTNQFSKL